MTDVERYIFDLQGYLHIPGMLSQAEARRLHEAAVTLEAEAFACQDSAPRFTSVWANQYWRHPTHGYYASGQRGDGQTLMVEDFWLHPEAFDRLIGHERTMAYISRIVPGQQRRDAGSPITINNSELRIRYHGNQSGMHMGFPHGHGPKYVYRVLNGQVNCMMVRMVYFLHDVAEDEGPMCFIPGSHKGSFPMPVANVLIEDEPGLVVVPVKAGDAILFTEACRHGGVPNRSSQTRYTLHVGYGPHFLKSQNIATMDEEVNVTEALLARLSAKQRDLLVPRRHEQLTSDANG